MKKRLMTCTLTFLTTIVLTVSINAKTPSPDVRLDLPGYWPSRSRDSNTVLVPARPLAKWLGVQLTVEPETVTLKGDDKTLNIERATGRMMLKGQPQQFTPALLMDGQLVVPLRAVAKAFGATAAYEDSSMPSGLFSYQDGMHLRRGTQRLWVPIYEQSPAAVTAMLTWLDKVTAGTYGRDWLLRGQEQFGSYATVSLQLRDQEKPKRYLLRRQGQGWLILATGENGHELSRQYLKQVMAKGEPAGWREALNFLTSNPPPVASIIPDEAQATPLSALQRINEIYFERLDTALRAGDASTAKARKLRREQSAFYAWFVRNYSGKAGDDALAMALYQQGMLSWALGDVQAARQTFRQLLTKYSKAIREYGPNGPVTYHQSLTRHRWVTVARSTPVYQYDARETAPGPPVLLKRVRVEPRNTLLVAYSISDLDGHLEKQDRPFFRKHLKLWEGSFVVPKRNCVSLAEYCLRKRGR